MSDGTNSNMVVVRTTVGGVETQLLQHRERVVVGGEESRSARPVDRVLVVVPGNPGVVTFYAHFAEAMYEAWGGDAGVVVVSHVGHVVDIDGESVVEAEAEAGGGALSWDLASQIEHKAAVLRMVTEATGGAELVLAGHSIGAHIVNELMLAEREGRAAGYAVSRGINMFPTLHSMKQQAGVLNYLTRAGVRHAMAAAAGMLGILPRALVRPIMRAASDAARDDATAAIVHGAMKYSVANAILGMARTEFDTVTAEPDLSAVIDDLVFYYGVDDGWAPIDHAHAMRAAHPDHPHIHIDATGAPHAFVVSSSAQVAAELVRLLSPPSAPRPLFP